MKLHLSDGFKFFGPGIIVASAVLGPGTIAVASTVGVEFGFELLWVLVFTTVAAVTFMTIATRFALSHDQSVLRTL
jgi:Mn2+/Fe2+ NRAMP family transporter